MSENDLPGLSREELIQCFEHGPLEIPFGYRHEYGEALESVARLATQNQQEAIAARDRKLLALEAELAEARSAIEMVGDTIPLLENAPGLILNIQSRVEAYLAAHPAQTTAPESAE